MGAGLKRPAMSNHPDYRTNQPECSAPSQADASGNSEQTNPALGAVTSTAGPGGVEDGPVRASYPIRGMTRRFFAVARRTPRPTRTNVLVRAHQSALGEDTLDAQILACSTIIGCGRMYVRGDGGARALRRRQR